MLYNSGSCGQTPRRRKTQGNADQERIITLSTKKIIDNSLSSFGRLLYSISLLACFYLPCVAPTEEFIDYIDSWLAPTIPQMVEQLDKDKNKLIAGLNWFHQLPDLENGAITIVIYRASGSK